jgi:UDP-glucose 6-dehydrogenase
MVDIEKLIIKQIKEDLCSIKESEIEELLKHDKGQNTYTINMKYHRIFDLNELLLTLMPNKKPHGK